MEGFKALEKGFNKPFTLLDSMSALADLGWEAYPNEGSGSEASEQQQCVFWRAPGFRALLAKSGVCGGNSQIISAVLKTLQHCIGNRESGVQPPHIGNDNGRARAEEEGESVERKNVQLKDCWVRTKRETGFLGSYSHTVNVTEEAEGDEEHPESRRESYGVSLKTLTGAQNKDGGPLMPHRKLGLIQLLGELESRKIMSIHTVPPRAAPLSPWRIPSQTCAELPKATVVPGGLCPARVEPEDIKVAFVRQDLVKLNQSLALWVKLCEQRKRGKEGKQAKD
ncbi:hypothetical protein EYF80_011672 [Liparis tanakae]|uniref:Uncharacterized protein n=1 Tax=Liparis tanakae TaxID=230148 RepID=A0A4Z2IK48_9TELE|nr:hypothetical protein EYF80_011672 [Liparis tanakae]